MAFSGLNDLPVFFSPPAGLNFYADDSLSSRQILSIFNPYNFTIKFKGRFKVCQLLTTAPQKFELVEPDGVIRSGYRVDIIVRCKDLSVANYNKTDYFRIEMRDSTSSSLLGRRDLPATILPTKCASPEPNESAFEQLSSSNTTATSSALKQYKISEREQSSHKIEACRSMPSWALFTAAFICLIIIIFPVEGDQTSVLPSYFRVKVEYKLMASYALGLLTMAIFK
ncbi:motile sperm domain-containing protein 1-like protein [Dinothrombium tinctorium]|uniref:Motile sperm domain-containing protein 1-like protein n=1 Tax=Dinothrombium tinctorium TaxID=1965070 RepID=A0A3S3SAL3_9ACAR|nr:motile sperm domain-containing protein 1-like protein [Dinothrombium tinctorium]RWS11510.1 motile sperm domain-containing protein 1-like protein [Dinothrombium tinctorium]